MNHEVPDRDLMVQGGQLCCLPADRDVGCNYKSSMTAAAAVAMAKNCQSWGEGRPSSEATAGTMTDLSQEAQRLADSCSGNEGVISGWGKRRMRKEKWLAPPYLLRELGYLYYYW